MRYKDVINLDYKSFMKLNRSQLAKYTSTLSSVANKRLVRLGKAGMTTPASKYGKFSVKNKDLNELRKEFTRAKQFLGLKSSTIRGAKKIEKQFQEKTNYYGNMGYFWRVFNLVKEMDPSLRQVPSNELIAMVTERVTSLEVEINENNLQDVADQILQSINEENGDVNYDSFFTV